LTYCGRKYGVLDGKPGAEKPDGLESISDWDKPGGQAERQRIVKALLEQNADPNILDFLDYSVLHYAAMLGWTDTVRLLLGKGVNHSQVNVLGQNCLQLACKVRCLWPAWGGDGSPRSWGGMGSMILRPGGGCAVLAYRGGGGDP
jgi:hypothetical protein